MKSIDEIKDMIKWIDHDINSRRYMIENPAGSGLTYGCVNELNSEAHELDEQRSILEWVIGENVERVEGYSEEMLELISENKE